MIKFSCFFYKQIKNNIFLGFNRFSQKSVSPFASRSLDILEQTKKRKIFVPIDGRSGNGGSGVMWPQLSFHKSLLYLICFFFFGGYT